jgi:hypothetical protein
MRQAQDSPGTSAVVQTGYLRGVAMGKPVARILPLQRTAPDGAALAQGIRHTASKPIAKGAYDKVPQEQDSLLMALEDGVTWCSPPARLGFGSSTAMSCPT